MSVSPERTEATADEFTFGSKGQGGPHYVFINAPVNVWLDEAAVQRYLIAECPTLGDAMRVRDALAAASGGGEANTE